MSSTQDGHCSVLVEDDGIGLATDQAEPNQETGEDIGLSVMKERAERINGEILFERHAYVGSSVLTM
ncbi:MAG: hypothetical protein DSZ16_03640 [Candidatus Thioglobus sp.]|nr:MAG: hypothetical protein DSZ16_03640 [Candidatus Thioglobus sp.]